MALAGRAGAVSLETSSSRRGTDHSAEIGSASSVVVHQTSADSNLVATKAEELAVSGALVVETGALDLRELPAVVRWELASGAGREPVPVAHRGDWSLLQDGAQPFFSGSWNGNRNNWYGDVGVAFVPHTDFKIVALGRHRHNETGIQEEVPVTLWSTATEAPLAILIVGAGSYQEGHYHWEPIDAPGVHVHAGREYRLTQGCTPGMRDTWFDNAIPYEEVMAKVATGVATFVGGVNQSGFGYPVHKNGQFRRPGMVNFKYVPVMAHQFQSGTFRGALCNLLALFVAMSTPVFVTTTL